jgi:hypothetical protein
MFKLSNRIRVNRSDISNYIEDTDIYNSKLLDLISQGDFDRVDYTIKNDGYRPDLISLDFYGESKYYGLFLLTCGATFDDFYEGNTLRLLPKETLDVLINSLK